MSGIEREVIVIKDSGPEALTANRINLLLKKGEYQLAKIKLDSVSDFKSELDVCNTWSSESPKSLQLPPAIFKVIKVESRFKNEKNLKDEKTKTEIKKEQPGVRVSERIACRTFSKIEVPPLPKQVARKREVKQERKAVKKESMVRS